MKKLLASTLSLIMFACASTAEPTDDEDGEAESAGEAASELQSSASCATERQDAYSGGGKIGTVDVIKIGGKRVTKKTGHAFLKFQRAAAAAGVDIAINSGFRTMDEQRYFYKCYTTGSCNNGNLAARPGYSNHQSGRALDISNSTSSWVRNNASRFGFERTVPSETWHFEYMGSSDPGGPCSGGGATPPSSGGSPDAETCFSTTLQKNIAANGCVQARSNRVWYRCESGAWTETNASDSACSEKHPL
jgi:hypothetical protein